MLREAIQLRTTEKAAIDRTLVLKKLLENALESMKEKNRTAANRAWELLGKEHGMFRDAIDHTHKNLDPSKPALNVNGFTVPLIAPGQMGVPLDDPFETGFGASGRNLFRAPFQERFDVALAKQFKVTERVNFQFRADFFNIFNHPSFDAPNNSVSLSNGGNPPTFSTPQNSTLGLIQHTIGSPRFIQLSIHLGF